MVETFYNIEERKSYQSTLLMYIEKKPQVSAARVYYIRLHLSLSDNGQNGRPENHKDRRLPA